MRSASSPLPEPALQMSLTPDAIKTLSHVSTATITTVLLKKGLRNVWMRGTKPLRPGQKRLVGPAFTLRFVPAREDLATPESWSSPISTRTAIEAMPAGCIAVVDAMGITDAGIFGDILCARMVKRGVAALITDGVVRDVEGVLGTGLPVWCDGFAAPPSVAGLTFVGWGEPIGCGGVAVFPNDIVVADLDGAVLIPQAQLDHILAEGPEQERMEGWIVNEVNNGAVLPGLYPMNAETKARYVISGVGRVQTKGGPIREIRPGDVVWIPPNEKHWHGASPTNGMTHVAMQEALDGSYVTWMEQVTDAEYSASVG